jgi:hypothetical protein
MFWNLHDSQRKLISLSLYPIFVFQNTKLSLRREQKHLVKISILSLRREGIRQSEQCLSPPLPLLAGGALQAACVATSPAASRTMKHQQSGQCFISSLAENRIFDGI